MSIYYIQGDATQPQGNDKKLIVHICNDMGGWGKGFVLALSKRWKMPETEYRAWSKAVNGTLPLGEVQFVEVEADITVANVIGQVGIYTDKNGNPPIRYQAVSDGLKKVAEYCLKNKASVHAPRFGAGLAGGKWEIIERIINEELIQKGISVTIYDFV